MGIFYGAAIGSPSMDEFYESVRWRLYDLQADAGKADWVMPVGIVLALPKEHGGDAVSDEIINRFQLLDKTSADYMDFHYLGWSDGEDSKLSFDLNSFVDAKNELSKMGVKFGGYADVLVLDASIDANGISTLHGGKCLHMNISRAVKDKAINGVGELFERLIHLAANLPSEVESPTFHFSDKLGAVYARESLLDFILNKWGAFFGAQKLKYLAVTNLGFDRGLSF